MIIFAITMLLIIVGVVLFQFTPIGYCMTIQLRDFTEVEHNIFINNTFTYVTANENNELIDKEDVPALINEARDRVADFFGGELQSNPILIISDNENTINKTGDRDTHTVVLHDVITYIAISYKYLNVDIIAHELTHAELHYRVLIGKPFRSIGSFIPIWFDEGLASINDYREIMSEEALKSKTKIIDVTKLTKADFQGNHVNDSFFNALIIQEYYLFSRHEVKSWIDKNGFGSLLSLIDDIRAGKNFYELYHN